MLFQRKTPHQKKLERDAKQTDYSQLQKDIAKLQDKINSYQHKIKTSRSVWDMDYYIDECDRFLYPQLDYLFELEAYMSKQKYKTRKKKCAS